MPKTFRQWTLGLIAAVLDGFATLGAGLGSGAIAASFASPDAFTRSGLRTMAVMVAASAVASALTSGRRYIQRSPLEEVFGATTVTTETGDVTVNQVTPAPTPDEETTAP